MTQNDISKKGKLRILIADDVHETRRNTRLMIATMDNVEVTAIASNGVQAVEMTKEYHPDIVVLDINMPAMDGLTAYKHIIQEYPGTGCIIISAESDPATVKAATSIGIQEYLVKPFTTDELEAAIKRVIVLLSETRKKIVQSHQANLNNIVYLKQVANDYLKEGRTDDEAIQIFERLAADPQCDVRWLEALAMIYAVRGSGGSSKFLRQD